MIELAIGETDEARRLRFEVAEAIDNLAGLLDVDSHSVRCALLIARTEIRHENSLTVAIDAEGDPISIGYAKLYGRIACDDIKRMENL